jgi:hypothetical protein
MMFRAYSDLTDPLPFALTDSAGEALRHLLLKVCSVRPRNHFTS